MRKFLTVLVLLMSISTFAEVSTELDGEWALTGVHCHSSPEINRYYWFSGMLEINNGRVESRFSTMDCTILKSIKFTEIQSTEGILSYKDVNTTILAKACLDNDKQEQPNEELQTDLAGLHMEKSNPFQLYRIIEDIECAEGKGVTYVYSKLP